MNRSTGSPILAETYKPRALPLDNKKSYSPFPGITGSNINPTNRTRNLFREAKFDKQHDFFFQKTKQNKTCLFPMSVVLILTREKTEFSLLHAVLWTHRTSSDLTGCLGGSPQSER